MSLAGTSIKDLSILEGIPLKILYLSSCIDTTGISSLGKIKSLEVLTLPSLDLLSEEDFVAIGALRESPNLRSISFGNPGAFLARELFWKKFDEAALDREMHETVLALSRKGGYSDAAHLLRDWMSKNPARAAGDFTRWLNLGTALLASGDLPAYQAVCRDMTTRFRRRGEGDEAAVRLCLLSPDSGVPITELRSLMPHLALIRKTTPFRCWFVLTSGLLDYRAGRIPEAIELLTQVETDRFPSAPAAAAAVLCMAWFRQGDLDVANAHLNHARAAIAPHWPNGPLGKASLADWLGAQLLLQEAQKLIGSAVNTPAEK